MNHRPITYFALTFCLLFLQLPDLQSQTNSNPRAEWFVDARFGMFIHWGVYSGAEGVWKGEKLRYDNDYAEWIFYRNRISKQEYLTLLENFDWNQIDPEKWVILAKKSGMKYVTLTAKHHDGFALWDSEVGSYDVGEFTSPKRDIVCELASACKKHGLRMGVYYSHWVDWEHPYGWDHTNEIYPLDAGQYDLYWQKKVMPQMKELLSNYGEIGMVWFDMWIHHSRTIVSKEQLLQLKAMIRELQPSCLVNSRLGLSIEEDPDVDFQTLGDNQLGRFKQEHPWQSPATVAHSWGYHALESQWKSTTALLQGLINNVSLNGNMMLNIGPRANGKVPHEIETRLLDMGSWLERNGESIFGAGGFDLDKEQHDWCRITSKKVGDNTKVYLHIFNWPLDQKVNLTGIKSKPENVYLLADSSKTRIPFKHQTTITSLHLPKDLPDPFVSVVVLEYPGIPETETGLVAESMSNGWSLKPERWTLARGDTLVAPSERFGSIPAHIEVTQKSIYQWRIFVEQPISLMSEISYSYQGESEGGQFFLAANDHTLAGIFKPTGRTVGEPRQEWQIDSYESHRLGEIEINQPGYYDIRLELNPPEGETVKFQWVWLER